jgi:hypothetical protein
VGPVSEHGGWETVPVSLAGLESMTGACIKQSATLVKHVWLPVAWIPIPLARYKPVFPPTGLEHPVKHGF